MRNKIMAALAAMALALGLSAGIAAPANAGGPIIPPPPIGGAGFDFPAPGSATPLKQGPAIKMSRHAVPRKGQTSAKLLSGLTYYYAGGAQSPAATKTAFAANMYQANPPQIDSGPDHSLMEMTVQAGTGSTQAILELGWVKQCSGCSVQLFASQWVNNVWGGSYVGSGDGWVDYAPNATNLGAVVTTGVSKNFQWIYDSTAPAKWWAYYDGTALGYYPLSLWSSASPSYNFTSGSFMQLFGEVADADGIGSPCTDMGTGILATGSGTRANATALKYAVGDYANMGSWSAVTNASWYNTLPVNLSSQGGTGANAFLGGPGSC